MKSLVELAADTAMRRGELLGLRWADIDIGSRVAHLLVTNHWEGRYVPLSSRAAAILLAVPRSLCGYVFLIKPQTVVAAFIRLPTAPGWGMSGFTT